MNSNSILKEASISLKDKIRQFLRKKILELIYTPGERIVEMEIARELRISQIPVREALCGLVEEGLVKSVKHKGSFVTDIDHKEMYYMYLLRSEIESTVISLTLPTLTKKDFGELHDIIDAMQNAAGLCEKYSTMSTLDSEFHRTLVTKGNIEIYNRIWDMLNGHICRFINYAHPKADYKPSQVFEQHKTLLNILEERNVEKAQNAMKSHIMDVFNKGIIRIS